ncbi:MAG TPA: iron donor protein CyaY [Polyangiaceae bacterium]|nr:iron donor protein CyaY [Polyangiaceae bacterium]
MTQTERDYDERALPELRALVAALDEVDEEAFDTELESDILTIEFDDGTRFVVNSHRAARQIWMAANRSAWHFDFQPAQGQWIAAKTGEELWDTLARVIGDKLGRPVRLSRAG